MLLHTLIRQQCKKGAKKRKASTRNSLQVKKTIDQSITYTCVHAVAGENFEPRINLKKI